MSSSFRLETKYLINAAQADSFISAISAHVLKDKNFSGDGSMLLSTLYFDDLNKQAYFDKIDGVQSRVKYRVRQYVDPLSFVPKSTVFLEKKFREGIFIRKERLACNRSEFIKYLSSYSLNDLPEDQMAKNYLSFLRASGILPVLAVTYKRFAFIASDDPTVRISLDYGLRSNSVGEWSQHVLKYNEPFNKDKVILEVKTRGSIPYWLKTLLRNYQFNIESVCKYTICCDKNYAFCGDFYQS